MMGTSLSQSTPDQEPARPREGWVRVASLDDLRQRGVTTVSGAAAGLRHGVAVFAHEGRIYAVDNRCPHMGFPLSRGTCSEGLLTCNWHYARFDLESGGTFDPWADDVAVYATAVADGAVWVDLRRAPPGPRQREAERQRWLGRLDDGAARNLALVQAKAVLQLLDRQAPAREIVARAAQYALRRGSRRNAHGWGDGLSILTAMANVLPDVAAADRPLALYHGVRRAAEDVAGRAERVEFAPLPAERVPVPRLKAWFRRFVDVRLGDAAERALRAAIAAGASPPELVDLLAAAATDHYYRDFSHVVDTIAKQCELLDLIGWERAAEVLPAVVNQLAWSTREEEGDTWRSPDDLVALVEPASRQLPALLDPAAAPSGAWDAGLPEVLLGADPRASIDALTAAFRAGAAVADVAQALAYAAALRLTRFPPSNEFGDWDTALHHFTYCASLAQLARRAPSADLARGLLHGAMVLYLGRFLNLPAARLPDARALAAEPAEPAALTARLLRALDGQAGVDAAAAAVYRYLTLDHDPQGLLAALAHALLREDAGFHDYQVVEEGFRLAHDLAADGHREESRRVLVGVARWLAAHVPTRRAVTQTYTNALRLHRGEALHEGAAG
jgi:nitrite reductase/ring-hydroxylating ferredoxin subunit